jgi:hypothetical protein
MRTPSNGTAVSAQPSVADAESDVPRGDREAGDHRICIKCKGRIVFLDFDEIQWVEAAGNYLQLHTSGETYVVRDTMAAFGHRLETQGFIRIHRSIIVNARYIRELKPWHTGEYVLTLTNGKELTLSRKYRSSLLQITAQGGCVKRIGAIRGLAGVSVKQQCEKCSVRLAGNAPAFACAHDCMFCQVCAEAMNHVCPNCGGPLASRRSKCSPGRAHARTSPPNGH